MKSAVSLISKLKAALKNRRGETLVEGVVSILVFVVLVATVSSMILLSLRITHSSLDAATEMQENFNTLVEGNTAPSYIGQTVDFTLPGVVAAITVEVDMYESGGLVIFSP